MRVLDIWVMVFVAIHLLQVLYNRCSGLPRSHVPRNVACQDLTDQVRPRLGPSFRVVRLRRLRKDDYELVINRSCYEENADVSRLRKPFSEQQYRLYSTLLAPSLFTHCKVTPGQYITTGLILLPEHQTAFATEVTVASYALLPNLTSLMVTRNK